MQTQKDFLAMVVVPEARQRAEQVVEVRKDWWVRSRCWGRCWRP